MSVSSEYKRAAEALAEEVRASSGSRRTWRKVTTLLSMFGVHRLTEPVRERIGKALEEAGLLADPPLRSVERYGTVRFTLRDASKTASAPPARGDQHGDVVVEHFGAVHWIDLDTTAVSDPAALHVELQALVGPALTREMLDLVLELDPKPFVKDLAGGIRNASTFNVAVVDRSGTDVDEHASKTEALLFCSIEFLQGPNWVVSAWQQPDTATSAHSEALAAGHSKARAEVQQAVRQAMARRPPDGSADLGLAIMAELAQSYTEARRSLWAWHEQWELDFDKRHHRVETNTLNALRRMSVEFAQRLVALNRTGMSRHPERIWFKGADPAAAEAVDEVIDRALSNLRALRDVLRTSTEMVATSSSMHQDKENERFQNLVTSAGAVLLVPGLVASFYGANTRVPGQGSWSGLVAMVAVMVLSAAVTFMALSRWRSREARAAESHIQPVVLDDGGLASNQAV